MRRLLEDRANRGHSHRSPLAMTLNTQRNYVPFKRELLQQEECTLVSETCQDFFEPFLSICQASLELGMMTL
jgi:hypothetical protein